MRKIVPIASLGTRVPEHGRIRLGVKTGKAMKSIDTFRFTSPDRTALEQIAGQYGGEVRPWSDPKASPPDQFEVITTAKEIGVLLPPEDACSQWYEMWGGGGCVRRCDGERCESFAQQGDDWVPTEVPCVCTQENAMKCKPYTRLNVVLRGVRFGGVWRLETKGWNAAAEIPGMEQMIHALQENGMAVAKLRLDRRRAQRGKSTRNYVVPVLLIDATPEAMLAGQADAAQLAGVGPLEVETAPWDAPALNAGPSTGSPLLANDSPDTEIVDAEIVEDDDALIAMAADALALEHAPVMTPVELVDEFGADAQRKLEGLIAGVAEWNAAGKVVAVKVDR